MSKVTIKMTSKGKRLVTLRPAKGHKGEGVKGDYKKDRNARHSYHQGATNGHAFDNIMQTDQHRLLLLSRERSFVRPNSVHFNVQGCQHVEELQRQRSFHQGQNQQGLQLSVRGRGKGGVMPTNPRGKPAMEIYRPPTLRGPNGFEPTINDLASLKGMSDRNKRGVGLNIHAKEFVSVSVEQANLLHHSKSSSSVPRQVKGIHHSKSGQNLSEGEKKSPSPPKVHFSDDKENQPRNPSVAASSSPIKRSKSLGAADVRPSSSDISLVDVGPFPQDVQATISKAINDPNALSARLLMEVVRHVIARVIEASRFSEPTARLCIAIIEKEKGETFLETLLNTCQEFFQQRQRLLRNTPAAPALPGYGPTHSKWIAYMAFLNEMYSQLKRRHMQLMTRRMRNSETAPGLLLLSLLAQCCQICLKEQTVNNLAEMECLFFVLTGVGKDLEVELPQQMARVMSSARDALMTTVRVPAVKKTLLQLIEMHAARWQLPAPAVMYYYPGSGVNKV